jgi:hypothetical protein
MGAGVAKVEGIVVKFKRNWPICCNPSMDKKQFRVV